MEALCLKEGGPKNSRMTTASNSCPEWASNHHGAVDDPSGRWRKYAEVDTANSVNHMTSPEAIKPTLPTTIKIKESRRDA